MNQMGYSFFAQYNTIVALAVPGGILRLILTVLATWSVLSLYATPSHKISILSICAMDWEWRLQFAIIGC